MDRQYAMLMAQMNQRRSLREQAFSGRQAQPASLLPAAQRRQLAAISCGILDEAEKLYDLTLLLREVSAGLQLESLLQRSAASLQGLYQEEKQLYRQAGEAGAFLREPCILLQAACVRLERVPGAAAPADALEEVVFLLQEAGNLL